MRVLVVDDEPAIADSLTLILNRRGYRAMAVYNFESAKNAFREYQPDIVVSDCFLPDGTGVDLAADLFKSCPNADMLMLSGDPDAKQLLFDKHLAKVVVLLEKPVVIDDVLNVLQRFHRSRERIA